MKKLKIIIFILVILLLFISIKIYIETRPLRTMQKLKIYTNEIIEEKHSKNEYFMYELSL